MVRVLVIGGGVAGLSCAIFLASSEVKVVVAERREKEVDLSRPKVGESLPPDARTLLNQLGVFQEFKSGPHLPCYGNRSYWGRRQPELRDFMNHPLGHGWHLDRQDFERLLERRAVGLGAMVRHGISPDAITPDREGWHVEISGKRECFDFLVDASGRRSSFAKAQGIGRLVESRQMALVAFLEAEEALEDGMSLIEATPEGWWYSAAVPGNRLSTVFLGEPDQDQLKNWRSAVGWRELLNKSTQTVRRIRDGDFQLMDRPRFVSAESGILESLAGESWLAIGDAAMSYDPIASHGITMAMTSARDASKAILARCEGDEESLQRYDAKLREAFGEYSRQRRLLYEEIGRGQLAGNFH